MEFLRAVFWREKTSKNSKREYVTNRRFSNTPLEYIAPAIKPPTPKIYFGATHVIHSAIKPYIKILKGVKNTLQNMRKYSKCIMVFVLSSIAQGSCWNRLTSPLSLWYWENFSMSKPYRLTKRSNPHIPINVITQPIILGKSVWWSEVRR